MKSVYKIGEVARKLGVTTETLRRWDRDGKFEAKRNPVNKYRVYTEKQVALIARETGVYEMPSLFFR